MDPKQTVLDQLDELIQRGQPIAESYKVSGMSFTLISDVPEWTIREFVTASSAAIDRIAGRESQFYRQLVLWPQKTLHFNSEIVMSVLGSLRALHESVKKGYLMTVQQLAHAEVLDDFMVQSRTLLDAGYHVAAMVLVGGVLEEHLGKLCVARSISTPVKPGLGTYNDALRGVVFDQPTWRRLQALGDLRNLAAHGQGAKVKAEDVEDAWTFAGRFLADYPR